MSILIILMPVAILLGVGFVAAFVYSVRSGQYDDLDTPAHRILLDDAETENKMIKTENGNLINSSTKQV